MTVPTTAFVHVEIVHPDPDSAARFMEEVLGAERVEQNLSTYLETLAEGVRVIHVRAGGVVFQFVKPVPALESWQRHLDEHGAGVHNVTLMVDGLESVREVMRERGCPQAAHLEIELGRSGLEVDDPQQVHVMDATEQTGMRFELIETMPAWRPGEAP